MLVITLLTVLITINNGYKIYEPKTNGIIKELKKYSQIRDVMFNSDKTSVIYFYILEDWWGEKRYTPYQDVSVNLKGVADFYILDCEWFE